MEDLAVGVDRDRAGALEDALDVRPGHLPACDAATPSDPCDRIWLPATPA